MCEDENDYRKIEGDKRIKGIKRIEGIKRLKRLKEEEDSSQDRKGI